jgi:hypothetical protein
MAQGMAAGVSTLPFIQSLKLMASTKLKTIIVAGLLLILLVGVTVSVSLKTVHSSRPSARLDITGAWEGVSEIPGVTGVLRGEAARTRVVIKVSRTNGIYIATCDVIDTSPNAFQITNVVYDPPSVHFQADQGISYQGTLNAAGTELAGTVTWPGFTPLPALFKRTAMPSVAPVSLTESDYARRAGSDLQGLWNGRLGNGAGAVRVTVKISEPSAGTFRAQLDNTTGIWLGQPMTVSYRQPDVKLLVASGAGMFEGTMNADTTEMVGVWKQAGMEVRAKFRRADQ